MQIEPQTDDPGGDEDVALELAFSSYRAPTAEGFTERLEVLEKARGSLLEEGDYREWREAIFTDLASPKPFSATFGVILYPLAVLALAGAGIGYFLEIRPLFLGGSGLLFVVLASIAVLAIVHRRTRVLSHSDRLQIVDHLLAHSIITPEEAASLRDRIRGTSGGGPESSFSL